MYFDLFLTDIRKHIDTLIDDDVTDWGIKFEEVGLVSTETIGHRLTQGEKLSY